MSYGLVIVSESLYRAEVYDATKLLIILPHLIAHVPEKGKTGTRLFRYVRLIADGWNVRSLLFHRTVIEKYISLLTRTKCVLFSAEIHLFPW